MVPRDGLDIFEKRKISLLCHKSSSEPSNPQSSHFTDYAIPPPLRNTMRLRKSHIMNPLSHIGNGGRFVRRTYIIVLAGGMRRNLHQKQDNNKMVFSILSVLYRSIINLEQAMKAQTVSTGIAVLFLYPRRQVGDGGQHHVPTALPPRKKLGTNCTGGWVGPRAGLDRCGNLAPPHWDSIPTPLSPQRVAISLKVSLRKNA